MARTVQCVKLGRALLGLEKPPFTGELGEKIYNEVSQEAWEMWPAQRTILINHFGLSLGDPNARQFLREQMEEFFFGEDAPMPEGWTSMDSPAPMGKGGGPMKK